MVEDDVSYSKVIRRLLSKNTEPAFETIHARNMQECLHHLSSEIPEVILLDLGLPDSSGLDTLAKVVESSCGAPIIVLTGSDDDADGVQAVKLGAQDYLLKHLIANDTLIRTIRYGIERKRFEESTLRMAAIQDFVSALAHDLKIPMVGASNVLDAMVLEQFGALPPSQVEAVTGLRDSNRSQLKLVDKLLEIYKYEVGNPNVRIATINITKLILRCVSDYNHSLGQERLVAKLCADCPSVQGDANALVRLVINLLDNAVTFGTPGTPILITSEMEGAKFVLHIHNDGPPLPAELANQLFHKFWQGVPGKTYVAHTGFGLYLCHRIADLHKGRISCSSTIDEGTTITVRLPVTPL